MTRLFCAGLLLLVGSHLRAQTRPRTVQIALRSQPAFTTADSTTIDSALVAGFGFAGMNRPWRSPAGMVPVEQVLDIVPITWWVDARLTQQGHLRRLNVQIISVETGQIAAKDSSSASPAALRDSAAAIALRLGRRLSR